MSAGVRPICVPEVHSSVAYTRLGECPPDAIEDPPALRDTLDKSLSLVKHVVGLVQGPGHEELPDQVEKYRNRVKGSLDPEEIDRTVVDCIDTCRKALAGAAAARATERREMKSIVESIQKTVETVSGETTTFHETVEKAAGRFAEIAESPDVDALRTELADSARALRLQAAESQAAWRETVSVLDARVATLEQQLAASLREAEVDPLTQVANRRGFERTCASRLQGGLRKFCLLVFDVDAFKGINDTLGHPEGDRVLIAVATALQQSLPSCDDAVARLGGDEFAVIIDDIPLRRAEGLFSSIRDALAAVVAGTTPPLAPVTLSCGVTEYAAGDTIKSLLHRADEALYDAKRRGKNRAASKARPYLRDF